VETQQVVHQDVPAHHRIWTPIPSGIILIAFGSSFVIMAFWAMGGIGAIQRAYASMRGATLFVDSPTKSFGVAAPGDVVVVSFKLTNGTQNPVRIVGCEAMCGCTTADDLPFLLAPNESRDLSFSVHCPPEARPGVSLDLSITLLTNSSEQPRIPLCVRGEVRNRAGSADSAS